MSIPADGKHRGPYDPPHRRRRHRTGIYQLDKYRDRHVIEPLSSRSGIAVVVTCIHDGIRIFPRRGGWRHDPDEIKRLVGRSHSLEVAFHVQPT